MTSPHGIPSDLLDRILIIPTKPYQVDEIIAIARIRADAESVKIDDSALKLLGEIGTKASLRYVLQLLIPASLAAQVSGRETVTVRFFAVIYSSFFIFIRNRAVLTYFPK